MSGGRIDLRHADMPQSRAGGGATPAHPGGAPGFTRSTNQATSGRSPGMIDHDEPGSAQAGLVGTIQTFAVLLM